MSVARNPILPGCHPDPSICRVGDAFFLATSSFEYFPGLPVHRSTDLVHWELVGHAIHRDEQVDLSGVPASGGLFAPTIRYHDGRFLVACTLVDGTGRSGGFIVTAVDPAGPWSDPAWITGPEGGIDPSILIDRDGRAWWSATRLAERPAWPQQTEVWVRELDLGAMRLVGEERVVWRGALEGAVWAEGPHLYRDDEGVLLLASEGGTERHHAVSVARADGPSGPYRGNPGNPVLTHRHLGPSAQVMHVGHADLVDDGRGGWWAVALATRRIDGLDALQGRETWLAPVEWHDGWPVFAPGLGRLPEEVEVPWAAAGAGVGDHVVAQRFDGAALHPALAFVRSAPGVERARFDEATGMLRLSPASTTLAEASAQSFLGWPVAQPRATISTVVVPPEASGAQAGLVLRQSDACRVSLLVLGGGGPCVLATTFDGVEREIASIDVAPGPVDLRLELDGFACSAGVTDAAGRRHAFGPVDVRGLSPSRAGGFVGVWAGIAAIGEPGSAEASAGFESLRLEHASPEHASLEHASGVGSPVGG